MARAFPSLAEVRFGALVDAGSDAAATARDAIGKAWRRTRSAGTETEHAVKEPKNASSFARDAKALTDAYGLAYMAAKNVIGPTSIVLFYLVVKRGVDLSAWLGPELTKGAVGANAGLMALASWCSVALFPGVVYYATVFGPKLRAWARVLSARARVAARGGDGGLMA